MTTVSTVALDLLFFVSKIIANKEQRQLKLLNRTDGLGVATVVDFTREKPIDVERAAALLLVSTVTVRRWMRRGLEFCKLGGKVFTSYEAIQRFSKPGDSSPIVNAIVVDRETLDALKELKQRGFKIGLEALKDGRKEKVSAQ